MKRIDATLIAMALLLAPACSKGDAKQAPQAQGKGPLVIRFDPATLDRLGVQTEVAGDEGAALQIKLPGTLEYAADRYAEVGTVVEGRVTDVRVTVGTTVKKGQTLATVRVPAIASAQADAISAQAALKVARDHAKREASLLDKQLTTNREEELARGDATRAEAEFAAASAKLTLLGSPLPATSDAIRPNGSITLVSPIDGVVVRRDAVAGGFLEPKDVAFAVADPSVLWAVLDAYESDVGSIREGATVTLSVDALSGKTFSSKIAVLEPQLGRASRAVRARVLVDNRDGALRPGLFVRAAITVDADQATSRLLVPRAAVQPLGERDVVFIELSRGKFEVRPVIVGRRTPQLSEISDGLARGERIVVHGAFVLRGEATKQ